MKEKLLNELEKNGNIFLSCLKTNIGRSTFHRWKNEDKEFSKKADRAEQQGRLNNCDIGEHTLMLKVKEKDLGAIKYLLGHNSPRYRAKKISNVVILHKKGVISSDIMPPKTLEDLIADEEVRNLEIIAAIKNKFEAMGGIPPKADGSEIKDEELESYEMYIEEWYKSKKLAEEEATAESQKNNSEPEIRPNNSPPNTELPK